MEFTPQELYMFIGAGESLHRDHYRFFNKKFQLSKYIVEDMPKKGWDLTTKNIYPIITGPHISAFQYDTANEYCLLPYEKENTTAPIPTQRMLQENRDVFIYLANHKDMIDRQSEKSKQLHRGDEFYALSKIGPYTFADYIVAARDNTDFCASVISKQKTPWGENKQTICVKHTIIISQDINGTFISEDEAYYICGILNSKIVHEYMHSSFKSNGYSLNKANIYLPKFSEKNILHKQIVALAKRATQDLTIVEQVQIEISDIYLKICSQR